MAIQFLKNSELKGSTFRSRLINVSGRDISGDVFSLIVKNNFDTIIKTIVPTIQGNAVLFQLTELESLSAYTYTLEYWGDFSGLGKEIIAYETFIITETPSELQTNKNINITSSISIEDIVINLSISNPIIQVIGEDDGIGNKEYKISLSDLGVTGWEDPTFDDKVAEHIQTLDITIANNEIPYFVVEEPAPDPSNSNFRVQADWGSLGVTDQISFETWLNAPNNKGWDSEFGKYFIIDNIDDGNQSMATYTISNFSLVDDIIDCNIDGNGNCFDLGYCTIQEIISLPNNLIYLFLDYNQLTSFDPTNDLPSLQHLDLNNNQITSFDPTNELSSLQELYLNNNQISDWSQVTWIESIPDNGSVYLKGNPTSANSSLVHNALLAKMWVVSV